MSRILKSMLIFAASLPLASCSVFYPNWGATGLPETDIPISPSQTESGAETSTPTAEPTATDTASPSGSASASASPTVKPATVEILFASTYPDEGYIEVVAQVPNLSETKGECQLTLSGPIDFSMTVSAEQSSDFMQCQPFDIELSKLPSGSYQAVVEYNSTGHSGKSAPYPVEVP